MYKITLKTFDSFQHSKDSSDYSVEQDGA